MFRIVVAISGQISYSEFHESNLTKYFSLQIYAVAGPFGFFKGLGARVLYSMPATAICWSTYEFFKYMLSKKHNENYRSSVSGSPHNLSVNKSTDKKRSPAQDEQASKAANQLRYVIPKPTVIATDIISDTGTTSLHHNSATDLSTSAAQSSTLIPAASSRELPSISGVGVYTAINMNSMHTESVYDPSVRGCNR